MTPPKGYFKTASMENIVFGVISAFIITFYSIPVIIQVSNMKKLFDHPDDRKLHQSPIPSLGGLGIFGGFIMAILLFANFSDPEVFTSVQYYLAACMVIFFLGLKDDILILTPLKKLFGQIAVAAILIFKANLVILDMDHFLGIENLSRTAGIILSFATIIVTMNAYNLIDGVDGLAGSAGIITATFFGFFALLSGNNFYALIGFSFAGALAGFILYNFSPARIFMGDTGAMLIGLVNAILVIHFINTNHSNIRFNMEAAPAMGFGVLLIPLVDTLRVFGIRIMNGFSPFLADRNHIHHLLLDRGMSHKSVVFSISVASILFIVLTYFALPLGTTLVVIMQIALYYTGVYILNITNPKAKKLKVIKGNIGYDDDQHPQLFTKRNSNKLSTYRTWRKKSSI